MAFKMKGFGGFKGKSPLKLNSDPKKTLKKVKSKSLSDREKRIAQNKEFNAYAEKQGIKPPKPKYGDEEGLKNYEKFYGNKTNVNKLNKLQAEYFKRKK